MIPPPSLGEDSVSVARVISQADDRREKLATFLRKGQDLESGQILDCALDFHVFALDDQELGKVKGVEHVIDTGDNQPICQLPRRVPFALRKEISRIVQEMVDGNVVQESASPWASPMVLVNKDRTL